MVNSGSSGTYSSGAIGIATPESGDTGRSGNIDVATGISRAGRSGHISLTTGDSFGNVRAEKRDYMRLLPRGHDFDHLDGTAGSRGGAVGGSVELISGKSNDFKSGDISIRTTDEAEAGLAGRIDIRSGRVQHGVSGDVEIATGPSSGNGAAGGITLRAGHGYQHEGADVTIAAGNIGRFVRRFRWWRGQTSRWEHLFDRKGW